MKEMRGKREIGQIGQIVPTEMQSPRETFFSIGLCKFGGKNWTNWPIIFRGLEKDSQSVTSHLSAQQD